MLGDGRLLFSDGLEVNKKNWGRPFRPPQHGPRSGSAAVRGTFFMRNRHIRLISQAIAIFQNA